MKQNHVGRPVVVTFKKFAHPDDATPLTYIPLAGRGATPLGDRPFLRGLELTSLKSRELWRCEGQQFEEVVAMQPFSNSNLHPLQEVVVLTRAETPTSPPNYFTRQIGVLDRAGEILPPRKPVTSFQHPAPDLVGVQKELVTYERDDGVQLSATLYLPAGYQSGTRLPLIVWAGFVPGAHPHDGQSAHVFSKSRAHRWPGPRTRCRYWQPAAEVLRGPVRLPQRHRNRSRMRLP